MRFSCSISAACSLYRTSFSRSFVFATLMMATIRITIAMPARGVRNSGSMIPSSGTNLSGRLARLRSLGLLDLELQLLHFLRVFHLALAKFHVGLEFFFPALLPENDRH